MAHAASPAPEPASYQAIVERLIEAMRVSKRDLPLARRIINDELVLSDAPSTVIAYWDNHVMAYESPDRRDDALQAILTVVECPVEDVDTHAKAVVRSSQLAFLLGASNEMMRVKVVADRFFAVYDVPTFKALTTLNIGRAYMAMNRLDEAIEAMAEMATCDTTDGYDGYRRVACANIGLCCARLGYLDDAKRWANMAEEGDSIGYVSHLLRGVIALFEGRVNDSRVPLNAAYEAATKAYDDITAGEILLYRCHAYKTLDNVDAFWAVYQLAMTIVHNGSPYLRDQLEVVKRGVPNIA